MLTGAAIGKALGDPSLVVPVAFLSHFVLDLLPHKDPSAPKDFWKLGITRHNAWEILHKSLEPLVGLGITLAFVFTSSPELAWVIFWGAFFGAIPDVIEFLARLGKFQYLIMFFKYAHADIESPYGWYPQWLIGVVALVVLFM
jgi:hypothetical protein